MAQTEKISQNTTEHTHIWMIESPNGQMSIGRCECGESKQFFNHEPPPEKRRGRWNNVGFSHKYPKIENNVEWSYDE